MPRRILRARLFALLLFCTLGALTRQAKADWIYYNPLGVFLGTFYNTPEDGCASLTGLDTTHYTWTWTIAKITTPGAFGYGNYACNNTGTNISTGAVVTAGTLYVPGCGSGAAVTGYPDTPPYTDTPYDYATGCIPATGAAHGKQLGESPVAVAEPIDVASGNVYHAETDYSTIGANPLTFTRYYNSLASDLTITALGRNWRHNYDRYLSGIIPSAVFAERPDGKQILFQWSGSAWVPDTDVDYKLTSSTSSGVTTYVLTGPDDTQETYSVSSGATSAMVSTITQRDGYTMTLTHPTGQIVVTDSYGRTLTMNLNSLGQIATLVTHDGTTITYGYDVSGVPQSGTPVNDRLVSVAYPDAPTHPVVYGYSGLTSGGLPASPFWLETVTDQNGDTFLQWTYDAYGRGTSNQVGAGANLTSVTYNDSTGARIVTNAFSVADTYSFTTAAGIPKVSGVSRAATSSTAAATEAFTYDSNGYLATQTDWNGNATHWTRNSHGMPTSMTEGYGSSAARTTTIAYDATFVHLPDTVTQTGRTTTFTYDSSGNTLTRTQTDTTTTSSPYSTSGQTRVWTFTYDGTGELLTATNPRTDLTATTTYAYSYGALDSITDAAGHVTNITSRMLGGRPLTVVDPSGVTTTLTYDACQRPLTHSVSTGAGTRTTTATYHYTGTLATLTLPDGSGHAYTYDHAHRLTDVTDSLGNLTTYLLDALGGVLQTEITDGGSWLVFDQGANFDALGRLVQEIGGSGNIYTYDKNGNRLTVTDPATYVTTTAYDALNRAITKTDAYAGVTSIAYDTLDDVLSVQDPVGVTTSFVYDGFGDVIQRADYDTTTNYVYDKQSNLTQKTDAVGSGTGTNIVTDMTYDALDRPLTRTYPGSSAENASYTYDQTGSSTYGFSIGRMTSVSDAAGSLTFKYDERGNLLKRTRTEGSNTYPLTYTYDAASRIASVATPAGTYTYSRDGQGNVNDVSGTPVGGSAYDIANVFGLMPYGTPHYIYYGNGDVDVWVRDLNGNISALLDTGSNRAIGYTRDGLQRVSASADAYTGTPIESFAYDAMGNLMTASGAYGSYSWTYDDAHNRLTQTLGSTTTTYGYTAHTNRLASITTGSTIQNVNYSPRRSVTSLVTGSTTNDAFTYGDSGKLLGVTTPTTSATYLVDGFGQRFSKTVGSTTTVFLYGQRGELLAEITPSDETDYVYLGGQPVATLTKSTGAFNILLDDQRGAPLVAVDNSGTTVWSATTQPFGDTSVTGSAVQDLRLPGQTFDAEAGFFHNGARDYAPDLGRYLESDPIGLVAGINIYAYANADPIGNVDPRGLQADVILPSPGSPEWIFGKQVTVPTGVSIVGHGSPTHISIGNKDNVPFKDLPYDLDGLEKIIDRLRREGKYHDGDLITLLACETGKDPEHLPNTLGYYQSLAQRLANAENAPVDAPDDILWGYPDGTYVVAPPDPNDPNNPDRSKQHGLTRFLPHKSNRPPISN